MKTFLDLDKYASRIRSLYGNFRLAMFFVWESGPQWTRANIGLLVVQGLLPLGTLYLMKLLVDHVAEALTQQDPQLLLNDVALIMIGMAGVALLSSMISILATWVSQGHSHLVVDHVQNILHAKSLEVDLEYYENSRWYDQLHRAQQEASFRPIAILNSLVQVGQNAISLVAMGALLWMFHWAVVPVLILVALPDFLVRLRFANIMYDWQRSRTSEARKAGYLNWVLTRDIFAKEIRLFQVGPFFKNMYQDIRKVLRNELLGLEKRRALATLGAQVVAFLGIFGVYFFLAQRTLQGFLTLGDLVMYFQAIQRGAGFLQQFSSSLSDLYKHNLFLSNLDEFLSVRSRIQESTHPMALPKTSTKGIEFDEVNFTYPGDSQKRLCNFSFRIQPGEHVAFVGANGAGKTTLVKILCRLYDPDAGQIRFDGHDIREFSVKQWRGAISVIFQDFARYFLSARDNIALGEHGSQDLDKIKQAAQQAGAHEFIERLPLSYDTILGKWFEGGQELSVGEWQKVALSRAFFRDSQILVLDEPTSAMDAKAEAQLFERFHQLTKGRMAVLISHRMSTVKMADRIYVVDHGEIVESGNHEELMQRKGSYAELYEIQAKHFQ
jgi:ATP-binding cassette subfamily B protein